MEVKRCEDAGKGSDAWVNSVLQSKELYPTFTATYVLMMAAQLYRRVEGGYVERAVQETPTINDGLTSSESDSETTAQTVGVWETELQDAIDRKEKELEDSRTDLDVATLSSNWPAEDGCRGNFTCSLLRLKLNRSATIYDERTVAQAAQCSSTSNNDGGAVKLPTESEFCLHNLSQSIDRQVLP